MSAKVLDLQAQRYTSRTLSAFIAGREGAAQRAGLQPPVHAYGENSVTANLSAQELARLLGVTALSNAGTQVTAETAMRVTAVYACVGLIAGAVSTLPLAIFERDGDTRRKASHDYWWMLNEQANERMSAAVAWEYLIAAKLFHGDGYAELLRPSPASTRVVGWEPLHPLRVQPFYSKEDDLVHYAYQDCEGPRRVIHAADMIHLPSLGFDGLCSPSPITYAAREAIGTMLAADAFAGRFFAGGATFDYALKTEANLRKEQLDLLYDSLATRVASGGRAPLILAGGLTPAQLSINNKDAEILASRVFGVEEICRIFGVPPHMVGHTSQSTSWGTGIEQQGIAFVRYTLQRHLTPIVQEVNRKLWPTRARYFVEHVTAALERGDIKSRYEAYRIALGRAGEQAWMDEDEIRRIENMPPMPAGTRNNPNGGAGAQPTDPAAG